MIGAGGGENDLETIQPFPEYVDVTIREADA